MAVTGFHRHFPRVFEPVTIPAPAGPGVTLLNRIAISGHFAGWWVDGGLPGDEFVAYAEERSKGGVGLFVIGATSPMPGSGWMENLDDRIIPRYERLAKACRKHGTRVFAQLCHPGFRPLPGPPIARSAPHAAGIGPLYRGPSRHIPSIEELHELIGAFGAAAGRAAAGGVDGLELHSHESFLHAQMLNPLWNNRDDEYGGSLENRTRFLIETLRAMRAAIGPDLPLGVRLKLDDMEQRGMDTLDYQEVVRRLDQDRLVDYFNFTGGDGRFHHGPAPRPEGEWISLVRETKSATRLPVMHAGRIATPEMAEEAIREGATDIVCMTKTHIADPHFTRKVFENRLDDIRFCTRCLLCHSKMDRMPCVYNPLTSRELAWSQTPPADPKKRIVVVGAGPAGMEMALTAAARGHQVIVLEKEDRVGGQAWTAAASPLRQPFIRVAEFYDRQSRKGHFELKLNTEATADAIISLDPDVVVIATGSQPERAEIPGAPGALTVHDVTAGAAIGRHAVVLDREGFNRAIVAADYLSCRGIKVEFVTPFASIGPRIEGMLLDEMLSHLKKQAVRFWPGLEVVGWSGNEVVLREIQTGDERVISGPDTLVTVVGSSPVNALAGELRGRVPDLHVIGDANIPQTVEEATFQGARLGRTI
ncbi:MAG TPA: FAD-dependent oxidoreductase [Armatimonadota bacterium]|nr:FAD-dependent oxidoreductase [Armatimonadota bacterium]